MGRLGAILERVEAVLAPLGAGRGRVTPALPIERKKKVLDTKNGSEVAQ